MDKILEFLRVFFGALPKQLYKFFTKFGISIKKVPEGLLYSGIPVKVGDDVYALIKDGKEIFRGTKKEIDELAKKLDELGEEAGKKYLDELSFRITVKYTSKLDLLELNTKLGKQIASASNNFKRYFVKIKDGKLVTKDGLFNPTTHRDNWVDWIITSENELLFGHGHAFLSGNAKNIKNAGTTLIPCSRANPFAWSQCFLQSDVFNYI